MSKVDEIDALLVGKEYLKSESIYFKSVGFIKEILELPCWEDARFKHLLTFTIWSCNANDIKEILELPEWENAEFIHLLTSNIWKRNSTEIKEK